MRALARRALYDPQGPLTRDLLQEPGRFGLGRVPARLRPDATTTVVCGFCSTGCGLTVHLRDGQAVNLSPTTEHPVNLGMACPKGWQALAPLRAPDRATAPLLRNARGRQEPVSWEVALQTMTARFKAIQAAHGDAAVAFISSGQIVSEEMALLGALAKFGMGMIHGDGNTRQCMATAVTAYKQAFGFDAPPFTYADFEESDVIVLVGSNLCIAHPIMWERICRNRRRPAIIVVDPRKTETAMAATHHLPLRPKSDLVLLYGLARLLCDSGALDEAFIAKSTRDFPAFRDHLSAFPLARVAAETGLPVAQLEDVAALLGPGRRVSYWWTMGVNQGHEAVRTAQAIINLALLGGHIGKPGTGANSITGQCNAMGSRLYSNTTNLLGGHDFTDAGDRRKIAAATGIPEDRITREPSLAYDQIVERILARSIRGLWIIGTNPAHSWINQRDFHDILGRLDFLVVQDMYATTETARRADLVLPAAGWGEKDGTFINSERRIGLVKKVARPPGQALADFHIFRLVAEAWGCGDMFRDWATPAAVFQIMKRCSQDQPCDITGIDGYEMIDRAGGIQWPLPAGSSPPAAERRLFADGVFFHPDGRARFVFEAPRPPPERISDEFPFVLLTGRGSSSQWHTQTRTSKSALLRRLYPRDLHVEINPADAAPRGIGPGEWVEVSSPRGAISARAFITHGIQPGQLFVAMHDETMNRLTFPAFDPESRQPAYKHCAASVRRLTPGDAAGG
ncbi:MAG TPA: nitrate reductase [Polyangia bacterium]|nr:nitrate reductase [Polyangia bacterium]